MKFKVKLKELNAALDVVGIVTPRPITQQGGTGYLFVVRNDRCYIYSRDTQQQARVDVAADDVDGEGAFIFPADKIGSLKYIDGWIEFETGHNAEDDRYWVRYRTEGGANAERSTFDPRLMQAQMDGALEKAQETAVYPAALLREGINLTRAYLAKPTDTRAEDVHKTLQLFDASQESWAKGDGHILAADGIRACYFYCEAFQGKGLSIHGQHLGQVTSFLAKCTGDITIKTGEGMTFAVNSAGHVLAWAHHVKQHEKFSYYPYNWDTFILKAPKELLVKALRYVRAGLDAKRDKIRIVYSHTDKQIQFITSEVSGKDNSMPVGVAPVLDDGHGGGTGGDKGDFAINANIDQLLELLEPMKSHEADLRVAVVPAKGGRTKEAHLIRTIETFFLDENGKSIIALEDAKKAYECRVTRFMPSRE